LTWLDPAIHGRGEAEMAPGKAAMMKSFVRAGLSVSDRLSRIWRMDGRVNPRIVSGDCHDGPRQPQRLTNRQPIHPQSLARI
jgi:hypothetical protein